MVCDEKERTEQRRNGAKLTYALAHSIIVSPRQGSRCDTGRGLSRFARVEPTNSSLDHRFDYIRSDLGRGSRKPCDGCL